MNIYICTHLCIALSFLRSFFLSFSPCASLHTHIRHVEGGRAGETERGLLLENCWCGLEISPPMGFCHFQSWQSCSQHVGWHLRGVPGMVLWAWTARCSSAVWGLCLHRGSGKCDRAEIYLSDSEKETKP